MATLVTDTLNSKEVIVDARDAERAPWRIRTDEGDHVPAVLVDRARFERLQKFAERIADVAGTFNSWRAAGDLDGAIFSIEDVLETLHPGDLDSLP